MKLSNVPNGVSVWDNVEAYDRYAVLFGDKACFTMSAFPFEEGGYCRFLQMGYKPERGDAFCKRVPSQVAAKIYQLMISEQDS